MAINYWGCTRITNDACTNFEVKKLFKSLNVLVKSKAKIFLFVQWECHHRNQILRWYASSLHVESEALLCLNRSLPLHFLLFSVVSSFDILPLSRYGNWDKRIPALWCAFYTVCTLCAISLRSDFGSPRTSMQFRSHTHATHAICLRSPAILLGQYLICCRCYSCAPNFTRWLSVHNKTQLNRCINWAHVGGTLNPRLSGWVTWKAFTLKNMVVPFEKVGDGRGAVRVYTSPIGKVDVVIERIIVTYYSCGHPLHLPSSAWHG